jgi:hypothetical protein
MSATPLMGARVPFGAIPAVAPKPRFLLMNQADLPCPVLSQILAQKIFHFAASPKF